VSSLTIIVAIICSPQASEAFTAPFLASSSIRISKRSIIGALRSSTSSSTMAKAETTTKMDVSIPYDAAARLSFDEWRTKYGKGEFNVDRFEAFKTNYEAVTVANVIAAREARELSIANGQGGAVISTNRMELNEYADTILQSSTSSSTTTTAETPKMDLSIPYDAAARLSFDEWRAKYEKGEFNADRFEAFKANYEAVTVANVIAAREARELSIANGQGAAVISTNHVELNEYADMTLQEYEPLQQPTSSSDTNNSDGSIIGNAIREAIPTVLRDILPQFSQDPKSIYEQKVIARRESIDEARRQPKSDEEDAVIAARYAGMTSEERAFNILLDLGLADMSPDPEDPEYYAGIDDEPFSH